MHEHTASSDSAAAAAGYETCSGAVLPSQRVMLAFGISEATRGNKPLDTVWCARTSSRSKGGAAWSECRPAPARSIERLAAPRSPGFRLLPATPSACG